MVLHNSSQNSKLIKSPWNIHSEHISEVSKGICFIWAPSTITSSSSVSYRTSLLGRILYLLTPLRGFNLICRFFTGLIAHLSTYTGEIKKIIPRLVQLNLTLILSVGSAVRSWPFILCFSGSTYGSSSASWVASKLIKDLFKINFLINLEILIKFEIERWMVPSFKPFWIASGVKW